MNHRYEKTDKRLSEIVRTILIIEGFSEAGTGSLPLFTNGMPVLVCKTEKDPGNETIFRLSLYSKPPAGIWTVTNEATIIAYFFKPFTITSLFNIPATALSDKAFDLGNWNPQKYIALKTQLSYASGTPQKLEVLNHLLIQQQSENQQLFTIIQYATDRIMHNPEKEVIPELLKTVNMNERTFQRLFKKYIGITPTQYRRICQFQQSFGQLRAKQFDKISEVAYDNGFADQSHFNRSFKEFTRITPNDYLRKGLKHKNT